MIGPNFSGRLSFQSGRRNFQAPVHGAKSTTLGALGRPTAPISTIRPTRRSYQETGIDKLIDNDSPIKTSNAVSFTTMMKNALSLSAAQLNPQGPRLGSSINRKSKKPPKITYSSLGDQQKQVVDAVNQGKSVFFSGSAGTGKSHLLRYIIQMLHPHGTFVTASTGLAACNVGGITFHAFAGIGLGDGDVDELVERIQSSNKTFEKWRKCRTLVIDEVSMIDGDLFDKVIFKNNE